MPPLKLIERDQVPPEHLELTNWPTVLEDNLNPKQREVFQRRKLALEMYITNNGSIPEITARTGVDRETLRRLIRRCLKTDENGQLMGFKGLIHYKRLNQYNRKKSISGSTKLTGAFQKLLDTHPAIKEMIIKLCLRKNNKSIQEPIMKVNQIHRRFLAACKNAGLTAIDYPYNTTNLGKRALERYVKQLELQHFSEAARYRYGEQAGQIARSVGVGEQNHPLFIRPFERVQFDGHRIDAIFAIVHKTPEGDEIVEQMDRIWFLAIIDVATRIILGYHLSFNKEYSATDVLQCIRNAVVPCTPKKLTIPGLHVRDTGGYAVEKVPEARWALWDELLYDNGKANLAVIVKDRLTQIIGCAVNAGPVDMPMRRGLIERFFQTLEENGFHRLPNTTGSCPSDPRRQSPEKKAIQYRMSYEHLEELTYVLIANYNGTPHEGLSNLSPLEVLAQRIARGMLPRVIPEEKRNEVIFLTMKVKRKIKGSIREGRRPFIYYEGVEYRNDILSRSPELIGTEVDLLVNIDDLRVLNLYLNDGSEFGSVTATGKWGLTPHNLQTRKQINKLRSQKLLHFTNGDDPIECYFQYLEGLSKVNRGNRSKLAELKRKKESIPDAQVQIEHVLSHPPINTKEQEIEVITKKNVAEPKQFFKTITY